MKILFTGFEPSPAGEASSSWAWLDEASSFSSEDHQIATLALPRCWDTCFEPLQELSLEDWDGIVCVGERDGSDIAVERIALNENNGAVQDGLGRRPRRKTIVEGGAAGFWTGLPYRDLSIHLAECGLKAFASHSSGGGLGNCVFYQLMWRLSQARKSLTAGLVQVPYGQNAGDLETGLKRKFVSAILASLTRTAECGDSLEVDLSRLSQLRGGFLSV